jgi:Lar family restriction alleviation protein
MSNEETASIKPCPHCNTEDASKYALHRIADEILVVTCGVCGSAGPIGTTEDDALEGWNRRFVSIVSNEAYEKMMEEVDDEEA